LLHKRLARASRRFAPLALSAAGAGVTQGWRA